MSRARDELWAIACALNPRHQSQLRLLARQARRRAARLGRRWWHFEADYAHPLEVPAARPRQVLYTWRLRPLVRAAADIAALALAALLCARLGALSQAAPGLAWPSAGLVSLILIVMSRRVSSAIRLMRG